MQPTDRGRWLFSVIQTFIFLCPCVFSQSWSNSVSLTGSEGRFGFTKTGEIMQNEWRISSAQGQVVQLIFDYLNIECFASGEIPVPCDCAKLEVYDGVSSSPSNLLYQSCSSSRYPSVLTSQSNSMLVTFTGKQGRDNMKYFTALYKTVNGNQVNRACGNAHLTSLEGVVTSPGFPNNYNNLLICEWTISVTSGLRVQLEISDVDVEYSAHCEYDSLEVFNGNSASSSSLKRFCGAQTNPVQLVSSGSYLCLRFVSNWNVTGRGFSARWKTGPNSISLTAPEGHINFTKTGEILTNEWKIIAGQGQVVQLAFELLNLYYYNYYYSHCTYTKLEVYDGLTTNISRRLFQTCENNIYPSLITSSSDSMLITFSGSLNVANRNYFIAVYKFVPAAKVNRICGGQLSGSQGTIISPNFPNNYDDLLICEWVITSTSGTGINLEIPEFNIEQTSNCIFDRLEVFNGISSTASSLLLQCDQMSSSYYYHVLATSTYMMVRFVSNWNVTYQGFKANWKTGDTYVHFTKAQSSVYYPSFCNNGVCVWNITVQDRNFVQLTLNAYFMYCTSYSPYDACKCSSLDLYDGSRISNDTRILSLCYNHGYLPGVFTSATNNMIIVLRNYHPTLSGSISAEYTTVSPSNELCKSFSYHANETLQSPLYPANYPPNVNCRYTINLANPGHQLVFTFLHMNLPEPGLNGQCNSDFVQIGSSKYCGSVIPPEVVVNLTTTVLFVSDGSISSSGFQLRYSSRMFECGARVVTGAQGKLTSPGYPLAYPNVINCTWTITVQPQQVVNLVFDVFSVTQDSSMAGVDCLSRNIAYVQIYDGNSTRNNTLIGTYCGRELPLPIISTTNYLTVEFKSVYNYDYSNTYHNTGFSASYTAIDKSDVYSTCGGQLTGHVGEIMSPNYPRGYSNYSMCVWTIIGSPGYPIRMSFFDFNLQASTPCQKHSLEIRDGLSENDRRLSRLCGAAVPSPVTSSGNLMHVKYYSDRSSQSRVHATWISLCEYSYTGQPSGTIQSPSYPRGYPNSIQCTYLIGGPEGYFMRLVFSTFHLGNDTSCEHNYVEIRDGGYEGSPLLGQRYCGNEIPPALTSTQSRLMIRFVSDGSASNTGFSASFNRLDVCGLTKLTQEEGQIQTPFYPFNYPPNTKCVWNIITDQSHGIILTFADFLLEGPGDVCPYDSVHVSTVNKAFCASSYQWRVQTENSSMTVEFKSDSSRVFPGFSASFITYNKSSGNLTKQYDLYPFGSNHGDTKMAPNDMQVDHVYIQTGFQVGKSLQYDVFIANKGLVTFGKRDSGNDLRLKPDRMMICPYHSDIGVNSVGGVYYQLHTSNTIILNKASAEIREMTNFTNYTARMVLLVTWDRVAHIRSRSPNSETATIQLALISDGKRSFALIYYLKDGMKWVKHDGMEIVIGIANGNSSELNWNIYNGSSEAFNLMDTFPQKEGGHKGMWIYELGFSYSADQQCKDWYRGNLSLKEERLLGFRRLPLCPCNKQFLQGNWVWSHYQDGNKAECYKMSYGASRLVEPYGKECCYSWGELTFGQYVPDGPYAGSATAFNPSINIRDYNREDREIHDVCCYKTTSAEYCKYYYQLRPVGECDPTNPFRTSFVFGDPHIKTLDGGDYTFNGWGEYNMVILKTPTLSFTLQGRTGLAETESGTLTNATVFKAFGAEENGVRVFVELDPNTDNTIIIFANDVDYTRRFYEEGDEFLEDGEYFLLRRREDNFVISFTFSGIEMTISVKVKTLTISLSIPIKYQGQTLGLLGNFNSIKDDDFLLPNGTTFSPNISDRQIFYLFGQNWAVTEANSIMRYGNREGPANFIHPGFTPIFLDEQPASLRKSAEGVCGTNLPCIYDYVATGSAAFALATKNTAEVAKKTEIMNRNTIPLLLFNSTLTIYSGENVTFFLNGYDPDPNDIVTYYMVPSDSSTVSLDSRTGEVTMNGVESNTVIPSFYAVDSQNMSSPLHTLHVTICPQCKNNGTCDLSQTVKSDVTPTVEIAFCMCKAGWTGSECDDDFDACDETPCRQQQVCTDLTPEEQGESSVGYRCSDCRHGFVLDLSNLPSPRCLDIDECASRVTNNCSMNCVNMPGSYKCGCRPGYRLNEDGISCDDVNECADHTDICEQTCINTEGSFQCACNQGYTLSPAQGTCQGGSNPNDVCSRAGCAHGCSVQINANGTSTPLCFCLGGYVTDPANPKLCVDVDECKEDVCSQTCRNTAGSFACACFAGSMLSSDQRTCVPCGKLQYGPECRLTCECNGRGLDCHPVKGCVCEEGWSGVQCETDVDECTDNPTACSIGQICSNTNGSFTCSCQSGYVMDASGVCLDVDECSTGSSLNTCSKREQCVNIPGTYYCSCKAGYRRTGDNCTDIDECANNGGICQHQCINVQGSYNCECYYGYRLNTDRATCRQVDDVCAEFEGLNCTHGCTLNDTDHAVCICNIGYSLAPDQQTCIEVDECLSGSSGCSHNCSNSEGGFICSCPIGMLLDNDKKTCLDCPTGKYAENCQRTCACGIGATDCDPQTGCVCQTGWTGDKCNRDINECESSAVQAECQAKKSVCVNFQGSYKCQCPPGYHLNASGVCQDTDECASSPCHQICENSEGSYRCLCQRGFSLNDATEQCEDINECAPPGIHACSQRCDNFAGSYRCSCNISGYVLGNDGVTCIARSNCSRTDCPTLNGGCSQEKCFCNSGYQLNTSRNSCDRIDIDWCATGVCQQMCREENDGMSFKCSCNDGYLLNNNKRTCRACQAGMFGMGCNSTCACSVQNTATCNNVNGTCSCKAGWTGPTCGQDIDECATSHSGVCPAHSQCVNTNGSHLCICDIGHIKTSGGECQDCPTNSFGENCALTCQCSVNTHTCDKINGSCTCMSGWEGTRCENDINECMEGHNVCTGRHRVCVNTDGSYRCECEDGYFFNGAGVCTACSANHYGKNCSLACFCGEHGQSCDIVSGACTCRKGWKGTRCQIDINECEGEDVMCPGSQQVCINTAGDYECGCEHGYVMNSVMVCKELKKVATQVTVDILVPAGDLDNSTSDIYRQWNEMATEALFEFLKTNNPGLTELTVHNLTVGSIIIDAVILLDDQNFPNAASWLSTALAQLGLSNVTIGSQTGPVTKVIVTVSGRNQLVDEQSLCLLLTFISPCSSGQECQISGGIPVCSDVESTDNELAIIISVTVCVLVAIIAATLIAFYYISKKNAAKVTPGKPPLDHTWALPPYSEFELSMTSRPNSQHTSRKGN